MQHINASQPDFEALLANIESRGQELDDQVQQRVAAILADVRERGDAAVAEYTQRFDRLDLGSGGSRVPADQIAAAREQLKPEHRRALEYAADRIRRYHERQIGQSWFTQDKRTGTVLGQRVLPLDSAGLYVPGGKASYPSSVLMNALPAKVAGVERLVMVVPAPDGELNPAVLCAAEIAGVDEIHRIGGAQAVAALAYGTRSIQAVDKIVGPGNIYVATAKRMVFGTVDIDMIAGPSEILIIADESANPRHLAVDLLSQAEHDEMASSILISPSQRLLAEVSEALEAELLSLERAQIARASLQQYGALIECADLAQGARIANRLAPEHLELAVQDPWALLAQIRHAGAIFMGHQTPEAVGDYVAGPNHVLPTGRTARFSSPLGVEDFTKRSSVLCYTAEALREANPHVQALCELEGLQAHALSVSRRVPR